MMLTFLIPLISMMTPRAGVHLPWPAALHGTPADLGLVPDESFYQRHRQSPGTFEDQLKPRWPLAFSLVSIDICPNFQYILSYVLEATVGSWTQYRAAVIPHDAS